jgi:hypothetical protein
MANLGKSKKNTKKSKNMTRKSWGGVGPVSAAAIRTAKKKLDELNKSTSTLITPGQLSSSLPPAIKGAKEAITYANHHPGDINARELANIKIKIADYWTNETRTRKNWRKEKNLIPNHNARDWYEPGSTIIWKLNDPTESAKRKMAAVLTELPEEVGLRPVDDERSEMGKKYRSARRRFERRAMGLPSASPSPEK